MNAKNARLRFKLKPVENFALVVAVFIFISLFLRGLPFVWALNAITMVLLYFIYFYVLEHRAIGIDCTNCGKYLATNTPWVCGFCRKSNDNGNAFPFVHQCGHCGAEPRAYKCHHRECGKLVFLGADELEENFAHCLNASPEVKPVEEDELVKREKEKRDMEHEIIMTELTRKLNAEKQRIDLEKKRTPKERLEKSFEEHHASTMGAREIAEEKRKAVKKLYKGNKQMQDAALEAIEDWLSREI